MSQLILGAQFYRTVVVDPPWTPSLHANNPRRATVDKAGPQKHYKTLSLDEIIRIEPTLAEQCHVYIWCLSQHVDWGYEIAKAWNVEPQILLTWAKPGLGAGRFQCNTEHVLVCRGGSRVGNPFGFGGQVAPATGGTWFNWPRGKHSEKPQEFFDMVERISPPPFLEMYARKPRAGWAVFGDEL